MPLLIGDLDSRDGRNVDQLAGTVRHQQDSAVIRLNDGTVHLVPLRRVDANRGPLRGRESNPRPK